MLSIGMLGAGDEDYYLSRGGGAGPARADEYYLAGGEPPGRWVGAGIDALDLAGQVTPTDLHAVLGGVRPGTGERLVSTAGSARRRRPGMYLTFSAPKGVSLLGLVADDPVAGRVRAAHRAAVDDTLAHLERRALFARRGRDGLQRVGTDGFVAAAFDHVTSRAGDPQLHTHVLAANLVQGPDGRWSAPDSRSLFRWARTAGFVYQAALRHHLSSELGVAWGPVRSGMAEPAGIPGSALRAFSTRRRQIEHHLEQVGAGTARSAQVAALATRAAKDRAVPVGELVGEWRERAGGLGMGPARLAALTGPGRAPRPVADDLDRLTDGLVSPGGLTARRASFGRAEVTRAVVESAGDGATPTEIEAAVEVVVADPRVLALAHPAGLLATPGERRFSTVELAATEAALLSRAVADRDIPVAVPAGGVLEGVLAGRRTLSGEQAAAVRHLVAGPGRVAVLVGRPGTGKTFALDAAREAWQQAGVRVVGAAPTARAAAGLESGSGIPATTMARLLLDADRPARDGGGLPAGGVVVVDEAGMAGTRTLDRLLAAAGRDGAKVVLVGDPAQLPEIDAGGSFAALARTTGAVELTGNRRQVEGWERAVLDDLRAGRAGPALAAYRDHDRLVMSPSAGAAREAMVRDWWAARTGGASTAMFAVERSDVDGLNRVARRLLVDDGVVAGPELTVQTGPREGRVFGVGDEIVALRNDRRLGVLNGTRATVTAIDQQEGALEVRTVDGQDRRLPGEYLEAGHVDHGYALTVHKGQGVTVDRAFLLGSDTLYREAGYVAMSRGRTSNRFYSVADPDRAAGRDPTVEDRHGRARPGGLDEDGRMGELTATLAASRAQARALDTAPHHRVPGPRLADLVPARRAIADQPARSHRGHTAGVGEGDGPGVVFDRLGRAIDERADALTRAAMTDPPQHLTDTLGLPPAAGAGRDRWEAAARTVECYRDTFGVDGPDPLGPPTHDPDGRVARDHAARVLEQAAVDLGRLPRRVELDRGRGR